ncbi:MAG: phosphatase PAP2 family protein [Breznakia sp.]
MQKIDDKILYYIHNHLYSSYVVKVMKIFTHLGDFCCVWLFYVMIALLRQERRLALSLLLAMLLVNAINNGFIKAVFRRNRPFEDHLDIRIEIDNPYGSSFPSGHSANGFACAVVISSFYLDFGFIAFVLAGLIAISRMYLKVHYFSDVLIGSVVGILTGLALLVIM